MTRLLLGAVAVLSVVVVGLWLWLDGVREDRARLSRELAAASAHIEQQRAALEGYATAAADARARAEAAADGERAALARVARLRAAGRQTEAAQGAARFLAGE